MDIVIVLVVTALLIWAVVLYNRLVRDHHRTAAAWSDIEVQLKRRHDLIPKLVEAVKQYASYEQATMSAVIELRVQSERTDTPAEKARLEGEISAGLRQLIAVAEDYPDLKASRNFLELQRDLTDVENHLQYARRYYNGAVRNFNTRIHSFPDLLIARPLRYDDKEYFEIDEETERKVPATSFGDQR